MDLGISFTTVACLLREERMNLLGLSEKTEIVGFEKSNCNYYIILVETAIQARMPEWSKGLR